MQKDHFVNLAGMGLICLSTIFILFSGNIPASDLFYRIYGESNMILFYFILNLLLFGLLNAWWRGNWLLAFASLTIINIIGITYAMFMGSSLANGVLESLWSAILPTGFLDILSEALKRNQPKIKEDRW